MRDFLEQLWGIFQDGLIVFAIFLFCLAIAIGIGYSIFGDHDMVWLRALGVVVFVFLLGLAIKR
jgi:hypothetical protein